MNTFLGLARSGRKPRLTLWSLRFVATVYLAVVLAQPVLAGLFLTGSVDAIRLHGAVGSGVAVVGLVLMAVTVAYVIAGGRLWAIPAVVVLFVAAGLQIGLGHARALAVHVPLGVTVVTASVLLAIWVWMPSAARPRGARR
ncbi:hypothetical protein [Actinophytocola sp.]|uniref:hypothetical protein n=1 Tax=Actinophytocola sp. TaxID=1872138 RepID=UPI003D6A154B